jgi:hypothetical protein
MGYYRLYKMRVPEGRFTGFEEFEAVDDVAAIRLSEGYASSGPHELWCGKRKIRTFAAESVRQAC